MRFRIRLKITDNLSVSKDVYVTKKAIVCTAVAFVAGVIVGRTL